VHVRKNYVSAISLVLTSTDWIVIISAIIAPWFTPVGQRHCVETLFILENVLSVVGSTTISLTPTLIEVATALKEGKRKLEVDADYLLELLDYFQNDTNYTMQSLGDSRERLLRAEQREAELMIEIKKLTNKINELIIDAEIKQGVSDDEDAKHGIRAPSITISKIPLSKVLGFINKGINRFGDVYIKLDSHGNFVKFGTSEKELE
jgi:hypothetical protein